MTTETPKPFARITDEMVTKHRARIGVKRRSRNPWNEEASKDAIKHWAWGIGDDNPLWLDLDYAKASPWGTIIAPPTFLFSTHHGPMGPGSSPSRGSGMPGIHSLHLSDTWEFYEPVRLGDKIESVDYLAEVTEKSGAYRNRMLLNRNDTDFTNQDGKLVAKLIRMGMSTERESSDHGPGKYTDVKPWVYTPEELAKIEHDYEMETRRGSEPRYWEDVNVDDDLGYVIKGPLTIIGMISYWMAWGCIFGMTDKIAHDYMRLHPGANVPHADTNMPDLPERGHWGDDLAKNLGFPTGYDIGTNRVSNFAHLMTNWYGDHGFLKTLSVRLTRPHWLGDTMWIRGQVVEKRIEDGEHLVTCEMWGDNQRGERNSAGQCVVRLPSRK